MQKSVKEANKLIVNIAKLRGKKIETMDIFFNQPPTAKMFLAFTPKNIITFRTLSLKPKT